MSIWLLNKEKLHEHSESWWKIISPGMDSINLLITFDTLCNLFCLQGLHKLAMGWGSWQYRSNYGMASYIQTPYKISNPSDWIRIESSRNGTSQFPGKNYASCIRSSNFVYSSWEQKVFRRWPALWRGLFYFWFSFECSLGRTELSFWENGWK